MSKKDDVADLFKEQSKSIGLDKTGTDIIVANLNATTLPMCVGVPVDELDTDNVIIIMFVLDMSPSMSPVEQDVIEGFNDIMIPALKGARKKFTNTMVIGGVAFNENVHSLWGGGFKKLEDLPKLTKKEYDTNSGQATALYQAMLDAITATGVYTANHVLPDTGIPPKIIIVALSDGANNCAPHSPSKVYNVSSKLSKEMFVLAFAGFKTHEHVDFHEIARETGFDAVYETVPEPNEDKDAMKKRFRHLLGVASSSIISQSQTVVSPDSGKGFWQAP